jgi:hypothetical protein
MPNPRWKRKKGIERKVGFRRLEKWSPKRAHKFAITRLNDIEALIDEIECVYDEIDMMIVQSCRDLRAQLPELRELIETACEAGTEL